METVLPANADDALKGLLADGVSSYDVIDALKAAGYSVEEPAGEAEAEDDSTEEKSPFGPQAHERAFSAIMKGGEK
jgi:hypothetical protein